MILAATGHRPDKLGAWDDQRVASNLLYLAQSVLEEHKPTKVISGMALGWDTAIAGATILAGIPLIAAIPFKGQESRWTPFGRERYRLLLKMASKIVCVSPGGYAPEKMQVRNEWMVDYADLVAALFNGSRGGTRNCILYAQGKSPPVPVVNYWSRWVDLDELV